MKNFTLLLLLALFALPLLAQKKLETPVNQYNEQGNKIGKWVAYNQTGKVISIAYYSVKCVKMTKAELFMQNSLLKGDTMRCESIADSAFLYSEDGRLSSKIMTTVQSTNLLSEKKAIRLDYLYNESGEIFKLTEPLLDKTISYIPFTLSSTPSDKLVKVAFKKLKFSNYVGTKAVDTVSLLSNAATDIIVEITHDSPQLKLPQQIVLQPNQSFELPVQFTLLAGKSETSFSIKIANSPVPPTNIRVSAYGYHLAHQDFLNFQQLSTNPHFQASNKTLIISGNGTEKLLSIYTPTPQLYSKIRQRAIEPIAEFSIAKIANELNLETFGNGEYILCLTDFSNGTKSFKKIMLQKPH